MAISGPIIIIGFKACGKSLIGGKLATVLGLEFTDTDSVIENLHFERKGERLAFREIYKKYGGEYFRDLERYAVTNALGRADHVVSFGGGALMEVDMDGIKRNGTFVYLKVDKETLYERIVKNGLPAYFTKNAPRDYFEELYAQREPVYDRYADIVVENRNKTPDDTVRDIMDALK